MGEKKAELQRATPWEIKRTEPRPRAFTSQGDRSSSKPSRICSSEGEQAMRLRCVPFVLRRRSGSIFELLVCLSLALHLLLALYSLSFLHDTCPRPPLAHPGGSVRKTVRSALLGSGQPSDTATPSMAASKAPPHPARDGGPTASLNMAAEMSQEGSPKMAASPVRSKLQALFQHPLYTLPEPEVGEDDWLLQVRSKVGDSNEDSNRITEEWVSDDVGYDAAQWNGSAQTHPPWLRFHLGITRWALYRRDDPVLAPLTQQLAGQRIISAGAGRRAPAAGRCEALRDPAPLGGPAAR
uniref:Extracellular serine/threonine protein kinase FAM20C-like n=1 Tax=Lepisosteus oculatus TaxID=7918 RepID=W5LWG3_LEPOC|nr:PREDICTED: extracellular serine/threonine protein kinase FAM20C-like [Lepisosteus oculatus]